MTKTSRFEYILISMRLPYFLVFELTQNDICLHTYQYQCQETQCIRKTTYIFLLNEKKQNIFIRETKKTLMTLIQAIIIMFIDPTYIFVYYSILQQATLKYMYGKLF